LVEPIKVCDFSTLGDTIGHLSNQLRNLIAASEMGTADRQLAPPAEPSPAQVDSRVRWKAVGMIQEDSAELSSCSEA
jgi:hypothetical protein